MIHLGESIVIGLRRTLVLCLAIAALLPSVLSAQSSDFIPKSKKEILAESAAAAKDRKRIASSGITTINTVRYLYRYGKVDKNGFTESSLRYDERGNKTKETTFSPSDGSIVTQTTLRYDRSGNPIEETVKNGESTLKTVHRYNARNDRLESVQYKPDGSVDRKFTYVYDDRGFLLEIVGRLGDGRTFQRDSYLYDGRGNVVEFRNAARQILVEYDRRGNVAVVQKFQRLFKSRDSVTYALSDRVVFDYDMNDLVTEAKVFRPDSTVRSRTQYVRNNAGLLLEEREQNGEGKLVYSRMVRYDRNQNITEEFGTDRALKFRTTYKYDSRGNKVEMTTYDQINEPAALVRYLFGRGGATPASSAPGMSLAADDTVAVLDEEENPPQELSQLLGARLIAPDGTYLGLLTADSSDQQSIINPGGPYGFPKSAASIFNPSIPYGGEKGIFSPFNPQSPSPPSVYKDGKFFTYLTENDAYRPRTSPRKVIEFLHKQQKHK